MASILRVTPYVWGKLMYQLARPKPVSEVSWLGTLDADEPLVTAATPPDQEGDAVKSEMDGNWIADWLGEQLMAEKPPELYQLNSVWIHSHPKMGVKPSPTDEETWGEWLGDKPVAYMVIVNDRGETFVRRAVDVQGPLDKHCDSGTIMRLGSRLLAVQEGHLTVDFLTPKACYIPNPDQWAAEIDERLQPLAPPLPPKSQTTGWSSGWSNGNGGRGLPTSNWRSDGHRHTYTATDYRHQTQDISLEIVADAISDEKLKGDFDQLTPEHVASWFVKPDAKDAPDWVDHTHGLDPRFDTRYSLH